MGLYALENKYDLSTWYENNGAYDTWTGPDLMLDLTREILASDAYFFQGIAFPKGRDISLLPGQTFSGTLNLIPYSYIVSLTGFTGNGNQFTFRIYDKGAQTDVYQRQFAWFPTVISNMVGSFNNGAAIIANDRDKPFGPYFFRDPLIVLPPGVLQIQITNVAAPNTIFTETPAENTVQMFFGVAVPKTTVSLQNRKVLTATDPTGTQTLQGLSDILSL